MEAAKGQLRKDAKEKYKSFKNIEKKGKKYFVRMIFWSFLTTKLESGGGGG